MTAESNETQESVKYVVIDTCIWVHSTRLLSTALGSALLYAISRTNSRLALPEIIEREMQKHTMKLGIDAVQKIDDSYRLIEVLMGRRDDYQVPSQDDFARRVDERLAELSRLVHRVPFTFAHASGALARVLDETPPNRSKDQQFKDSAIWEAILELAESGEVHFVTEDKAFFVDRKPEQGPAANLEEEANGRVQLFYTLPSYLDQIKQNIPDLDESAVAQRLSDALSESLLELANKKDYRIGSLQSHVFGFYLTERPCFLAVDFELTYAVHDLRLAADQPRVSGTQRVRGNSGYDIQHNSVEDAFIERIETLSLDGEPLPRFGLVGLRAGSIELGRRTIPYQLKEALPG